MAILARGCDPVFTRKFLPGDPGDAHSRYIEAAVNGVLIASLYAPNGNPQHGPKFVYKLRWVKRLAVHSTELLSANVPVVLAGDFNVVPTEFEIYPTTSYSNNALVQPPARGAFQILQGQRWVDAIRDQPPSIPDRGLILSPCAAILPTNFQARPASAPKGAAVLLRKYGTLEQALQAGRFPAERKKSCCSINPSRQWIAVRHSPGYRRRRQISKPPQSSPRNGS